MKAPWGQNFLFQAAWQQRIVEAVAPRAGDAVLEIGGGPGDLTALLAEAAGQVAVVELDRVLAEGLRQRFSALTHVRVVEADVLDLDLAALAREAGVARWRVVGNLPYYITSPILLHLFRQAEAVGDATLMVQREVGERLTASPGTRAFGLLTLTAQLHARVRALFNLPPGAFRPAPRVESQLLRFEFAPQAGALGVASGPFQDYLRLAFGQKRKLLRNNLRRAYSADVVEAALRGVGLANTARAEELDLEQHAAIFRGLFPGLFLDLGGESAPPGPPRLE